MSEWVNFKAVKEAVSMEMILAHYGIGLRKVNQTSLRGNCPLPTHSDKATENSFSVSTVKNAWACQSSSCRQARDGKTGGNILDFVAVMESCTIRDAGLKIQEWFSVEASNERPEDYIPSHDRPKGKLVRGKKDKGGDKPQAKSPDDVGSDENVEVVNEPLEFQLKSVDTTHPYIRQRGINPETAEHFGIGYFNGRGSMTGRLVIPIHNEDGKLIAYAGRSVDDSEPKYKLPAGFRKSLVLFNLHRALETKSKAVVIVEGFFDCMKIFQAGFPYAVALMGSALSEHQEKLLVENFDRVVVMLDGDEGGRSATSQITARLMCKQFVRVVDLPDGTQPDKLSSGEIQKILAFLGKGGLLNE